MPNFIVMGKDPEKGWRKIKVEAVSEAAAKGWAKEKGLTGIAVEEDEGTENHTGTSSLQESEGQPDESGRQSRSTEDISLATLNVLCSIRTAVWIVASILLAQVVLGLIAGAIVLGQLYGSGAIAGMFLVGLVLVLIVAAYIGGHSGEDAL